MSDAGRFFVRTQTERTEALEFVGTIESLLVERRVDVPSGLDSPTITLQVCCASEEASIELERDQVAELVCYLQTWLDKGSFQ
jgi:hypothetical protein